MESITLDLNRYEQIRNWEKEKRNVEKLENDKAAIQSSYDLLKRKYDELEKSNIILEMNSWTDWKIISTKEAKQLLENNYISKLEELNKIKENYFKLFDQNNYQKELISDLRKQISAIKESNSPKIPKWIRKIFT